MKHFIQFIFVVQFSSEENTSFDRDLISGIRAWDNGN
jgi:hypothetical protein